MSRWDSVCMLGRHRRDLALAVERELRLGVLDLQRAAPGAARGQRACGIARRLQRLRPGLGGALRPGEDPIDARVVQPLVGADHRPGERHPAHGSVVRDVHPHGHREPVAYGRSEQASLDRASGSIGSTRPGT